MTTDRCRRNDGCGGMVENRFHDTANHFYVTKLHSTGEGQMNATKLRLAWLAIRAGAAQ